MSKFISRQISCPSCNREHLLDIATSLNVSNHARFRDEIIAGAFQRFICDGCGKTFLVDDPFIYTDFTRRHWIYMFPQSWQMQWSEFENEPRDVFEKYMTGTYSSPIARSMADGYRLRTVFGLPALAEKILCFLHDIDDRWLEILKLKIMHTEVALFNSNYFPRLISVEPELNELTFSLPTMSGVDILAMPLTNLKELMESNIDYSEIMMKLNKSPYVDSGRILIAQ